MKKMVMNSKGPYIYTASSYLHGGNWAVNVWRG